VDAQVIARDGKVLLRKYCPEHGWSEALQPLPDGARDLAAWVACIGGAHTTDEHRQLLVDSWIADGRARYIYVSGRRS
jgi:hypothetical protein